jgi:hypothetical protein
MCDTFVDKPLNSPAGILNRSEIGTDIRLRKTLSLGTYYVAERQFPKSGRRVPIEANMGPSVDGTRVFQDFEKHTPQ